ncbi:estrogen-related receptor gamma-like [Diadema setosum]|uniref:estrogen-related receptor gamma-like n=1 Tax=Diadema setosum TaxID=31175 RepID=UPI003B3AA912
MRMSRSFLALHCRQCRMSFHPQVVQPKPLMAVSIASRVSYAAITARDFTTKHFPARLAKVSSREPCKRVSRTLAKDRQVLANPVWSIKRTETTVNSDRFQKCLSVGMRTDVVRPDRRPGGQRKTKELHVETPCPEKPSASSSWRQPRPDVEQPEVDTGSKGVLYYQSLDADAAEPWKLAIRELIQTRPDSIPQVGKDDPEALISRTSSVAGAEEDFLGPSTERAGSPMKSIRGLSQQDVIQAGYNELILIIEWAKGIGRFRSLLLEDQMCLLKSSFMDLQVMRVAYRSIDTYPLIHYTEKYTLSEAESKELGWGEACEETIRFCSTLVELKLDLVEFSILQALVLCFPDANGLKEVDRVRALQKFYLECLHKHEQCAFPGDNTRYGKLLMRLPSLRRVSARSVEQFFRLKLEGKIDVYDLVKEMMNFGI